MTTPYLYTDGSTVELHPVLPLWNTPRRGRITNPESRPPTIPGHLEPAKDTQQ
jgi:hypothetical protein